MASKPCIICVDNGDRWEDYDWHVVGIAKSPSAAIDYCCDVLGWQYKNCLSDRVTFYAGLNSFGKTKHGWVEEVDWIDNLHPNIS